MAANTQKGRLARVALIAGLSSLLLAGGLGLRASNATPSNNPSDSRVEAEVKIAKLTNCYAVGIDAIGQSNVPAGLDIWDDCFTSDATFAVWFAGSNFNGPPDYTTVGTTSWGNFANSFFRNAGYVATQHLMGTIVVDVDGPTANMSSYLQASHFLADGSVDIAKGTYEDEVVRENGRWKIKRRTLKLISSMHQENMP